MRDLQVNLIELDEQWDFIGKKQKRVRQDDPAEMGDVWLFVALAATQKAVLSTLSGNATRRTRKPSHSICGLGFSIARRSLRTATRRTRTPSCSRSKPTWITRS